MEPMEIDVSEFLSQITQERLEEASTSEEVLNSLWSQYLFFCMNQSLGKRQFLKSIKYNLNERQSVSKCHRLKF